MKFVKIGQTWYTTYEGRLLCNNRLVERVEAWDQVSRISPAEFEELRSEFGERIRSDDPATESGAGRGATPITEIELEDPTTVAKFDSWHAAVGVRQILLEDPAAVDKFVTYHAVVTTKKSTE